MILTSGLDKPAIFMVRVADGIELTPGIGNFKQERNIGLTHQGAAVPAAAEIMVHGEIHAPADIDHRRVQRLR